MTRKVETSLTRGIEGDARQRDGVGPVRSEARLLPGEVAMTRENETVEVEVFFVFVSGQCEMATISRAAADKFVGTFSRIRSPGMAVPVMRSQIIRV